MRALNRQIGFCSSYAVPLFGVARPGPRDACWPRKATERPPKGLAPVCVQFLAPRWSLKRLAARAAARGLPKRRAGHLGTVGCTEILHLVDSVGTGFPTATQPSFCGVDQSHTHSQIANGS